MNYQIPIYRNINMSLFRVAAIIFTLPFLTKILNCSDLNTIQMLNSYFVYENEDRPANLLMPNICWTYSQIASLARMLSTHSINLAVSLQGNQTASQIQHSVIVVDMNCPGSSQVLVFANEMEFFKSPYRWLIIVSDEMENKLDDEFKRLDILVDSQVVVAKRKKYDTFFLMEVYKISTNSSQIKTSRGMWISKQSKITKGFIKENGNLNKVLKNKFKELDISQHTRTFVTRVDDSGIIVEFRRSKVISLERSDLRGHVLTMSNVITDSNETKKHMSDRLNLHQDSIAKMSYSVVSVCFRMLNATERLVFTDTWGYRDRSGRWQGLVQQLVNREADIGTLTIFTKDRASAVDYIAMVGKTSVRFVFREPPLAYVSNIFTLPFSRAVWLAIVVCVLGSSVLLYVTSKWEASLGMHQLQLDGSWADVLILIIGAVMQQGCTLEPRYAAGRSVTLFLCLALTTLYAAYSANIVVLLRAPSASVRSLQDLLRSPVTLGASDFEYNRYFFKKLNDPLRKAIYDKKIAPKGKRPNFYNMSEGVERIRQGLFAFHMELNPGYRLIQDTYREHEKCDLVEVDYIRETDPWAPAQRRSPYKELFKINLLRIRESGVQACLHHRLQVPRPRCSGPIPTFSSVGVLDIKPALLGMLYGFLLAPAVLIVEIVAMRLMVIKARYAAGGIPYLE